MFGDSLLDSNSVMSDVLNDLKGVVLVNNNFVSVMMVFSDNGLVNNVLNMGRVLCRGFVSYLFLMLNHNVLSDSACLKDSLFSGLYSFPDFFLVYMPAAMIVLFDQVLHLGNLLGCFLDGALSNRVLEHGSSGLGMTGNEVMCMLACGLLVMVMMLIKDLFLSLFGFDER